MVLAGRFFWGQAPINHESFSAISSPEISENHISVNGVTTWTLRMAMVAATTTPCSFPNPAGAGTSTTATGGPLATSVGMATSSLTSFAIQITTGTSTAMNFDIASSTTTYGSSTQAFVFNNSVASGAQFSALYPIGGVATSSDKNLTASNALDGNIVRPLEFVNMKTGVGLGGYTYTGQCIATFRSVNAF